MLLPIDLISADAEASGLHVRQVPEAGSAELAVDVGFGPNPDTGTGYRRGSFG
jgi:hypothetical protein